MQTERTETRVSAIKVETTSNDGGLEVTVSLFRPPRGVVNLSRQPDVTDLPGDGYSGGDPKSGSNHLREHSQRSED